MNSSQNGRRPTGLIGGLRALFRERRGNVAAIVAILLVPLVGALAMGAEVTDWFMVQRAAQNTADTAVIAAATQGGNGGTDYAAYGQSVASKYGFTNGTANTTVTVTNGVTSVAACSPACYEVQVTKVLPIHLVGIVGYRGDAALSGGGTGEKVTAVALATLKTVLAPFCLLSMNGNVDASGVPHSDMTCNMFTNGSATCNGHDITSGFSDSTSSTNDCGGNQLDGQVAATNPYAGLASNIPSHTCSNYTPNSSTLSGTLNSSTPYFFCGDWSPGGNVQITNPNTVIVIENGALNTGNFTIQTAPGAGATIIFNGPNGNTYTGGGQPANFITGNGTLDVAAPTSGAWSGIAVYQNSNLTTQNVTYTGNSPTFAITGVINATAENFTAKGAVSKSTNGLACFTLVVNSLVIKGTGDLFYSSPQSQCANAGVTQVLEPGQFIGQLVF